MLFDYTQDLGLFGCDPLLYVMHASINCLFFSKYDYDSEFQSLVHCFVTYLFQLI